MKIFFRLILISSLLSGCNAKQLVRFVEPTLTNTQTVENSPTPSATYTPIPLTTGIPLTRIIEADSAFLSGDYENARQKYEDAYMNATEPSSQSAALLGMGKVQYASRNFQRAIDLLERLLANYPQELTAKADANYFIARCYSAMGFPLEAANAYTQYLQLKNGYLSDYIQELRGDALRDAKDHAASIVAYEFALRTSPSASVERLNTKIGLAYASMGDHEKAIRTFLDIYNSTGNDYVKAQMNRLTGDSYLLLGLNDQAYARYQDSVQNYPLSYDSYLGLVTLVNDGIPVDEKARGIVNYFAGQYGLAIDALDRYIENNPQLDGTALHYKALSLRANGETEKAIKVWEEFVEIYPDNQYWTDAWDQIIYTQWAYLKNHQMAANTSLNFVKQYSASPHAPDILFEAARIFERGKNLQKAAETWERLIDEYPSSNLSYQALFLTGISYYRIKDYSKALNSFQRILVLGTTNEELSIAYFWIGKTQSAQNMQVDALESWELAYQRDIGGYYSYRAKELSLGLSDFVSSNQNYDLSIDWEYERNLAENWLRTKFNIPMEIDLASKNLIENNLHFQRGNEFWGLGLYAKAKEEFEELRSLLGADPASIFQLLNHLLDSGLFQPAIFISRDILDLSGIEESDLFTAPEFFNHIRFGVFYQDVVLPVSESRGLNPLFIFSVIRTESLFDSGVTSSAGAQGLMQIMPATGAEIVKQMNWPLNYTDDDLNRPYVNITLGIQYLARQKSLFEEDTYAALSAYNGGPGNTLIWYGLADGDPDLFLEIIRFRETRNYIKQVAVNFYNYDRLYSID